MIYKIFHKGTGKITFFHKDMCLSEVEKKGGSLANSIPLKFKGV
tara:strand:- start:986 stop:1117 length:132 start_codon:yes stop_codon:yes gene_type:complete